jgi:DUF4097 and DUF4098 domain-containing protein YvlB
VKVKKLALLTLPALSLWAAGSGQAGEKVDEVLVIDPNGSVHIHCTRGDLRVLSWDREEAQVTGELDDLARDLQFEVHGDHTLIRVRLPDRGINRGDGADLTVHLPGSVRLQVEAVSADVTIEGMAGPLAVRTVSGDVKATGVHDLVHVSTTSGDIDLSEGRGRVKVTTTSGETSVHMAATDVQVDSVSGDIELELEAFDSVIANMVNAELELDGLLRPDGRIESSSISSDVELNLEDPVNASIIVRAGPGGEIDNDLSDHEPEILVSRHRVLEAELGDASGRIQIDTVSGEVNLNSR